MKSEMVDILIYSPGISDTDTWSHNYNEVKEHLKRGDTGTFKVYKDKLGIQIVLKIKKGKK